MPVAKSRLECLQIRKLLQSVHEKDNPQIEKLISYGVPHLINYNEPNDGSTPLSTAAMANDEETLQFLLDLGAHPDVVDFEGRSAIMRAAEYGHVQCFEALAKAGADLKLCDLKGKSVLFYCIASTDRHAKCMEIALKYHIDVNMQSKDGRTVFFAACETSKDNVDTCLALLDVGADPNISQAVTGRTPLMAACASGSGRVVMAAARKGADVNAVDKHGRTAAHEAAKGGHFEALVALAANGAIFDVYDSKGNNPIHFASMAHANCCKFLGQRGCNPKVKNEEGLLPRVIAKDNGHNDCVKELRRVEKTFGREMKNAEPWAIQLYDWATSRESDIIERLKKVDPDDTGVVVKEEFKDIVKELGAPWTDEADRKLLPLFDKNKDGKFDYKDFLTGKKYVNKNYLMSSYDGKKKKKKGGKGGKGRKAKIPLDICVMPEYQMARPIDGGPPVMFIPKESHFTDTDRFSPDKPPSHPLQDDSVWYLSQPDKQYISLNDAAKHGDLDSIKLALKQGYSIDTRDRYYKTPLMFAAHYGNLDACKMLIECGADVNAKDNFHWTALHHAAHAGMIDVVELLVNNGAALDAVALNGATPLFRAIESSRLQVVDFLVKRGAKVQVENRKGNTPMDVAYFWADPRVIDTVRTKVSSLPAPKDKKGAKGGKGASPKPKAAPSGNQSQTPPPANTSPSTNRRQPYAVSPPQIDWLTERRRASILRAASALASGELLLHSEGTAEDITFCPRLPWLPQPTTEARLSARQGRRERFGWEVDFPEYMTPFQKNVMDRVGQMMLDGDD